MWEAAAAGTPSAELPAYRFQPPCDQQLAGLLPHLSHWPWQDPPAAELRPAVDPARPSTPAHCPPLSTEENA